MPDFDEPLAEVVKGDVAFLIGSGFSRSAVYPATFELERIRFDDKDVSGMNVDSILKKMP